MNILLVDDEEKIIEVLEAYLKKEGFSVFSCSNGEEALKIFDNNKIDLILLDLMLPDLSGEEVCKVIRAKSCVPIIMITAKTEEEDLLEGFDIGADDYVTKPFSVRELMARVKANLRKLDIANENNVTEKTKQKQDEHKSKNKIEVGDLVLDLDKFEVKVRGEVIDLTLREFEVLKYLAKQPGQVITREVLLEKVWGYEYYGDIRTVDVTVRRIREKIESDTSNPKILVTKRGVGYYIYTDK